MKKFVITIMVCLAILAPTTSKADEVISLKQGDKAPFSGWLFSIKKEEQIRHFLIERDAFKMVNDSLEKSLILQTANFEREQQKLGICQEQNDKLAKNLYAERSFSDLERIVWFSLGVLATIGAVYGASRLK